MTRTRFYPSTNVDLTGPTANPYVFMMPTTAPGGSTSGYTDIYHGPSGIGPEQHVEALTTDPWVVQYTNGPWGLWPDAPVQGWSAEAKPTIRTEFPYLVYGWRTSRPLTGHFNAGTWLVRVRVHINKHGWTAASFKGYLYGRLYRGNADGTRIAEIGQQRGSVSTFINMTSAGDVDTTIPIVLNKGSDPNIVLNNEYLYLQISPRVQEWSATGPAPVGGDPSLTISLEISYGANTYIDAPEFYQLGAGNEEVCNPRYFAKEQYIYIAPDGLQYPLDVDGRRVVLTDENTGMPDIDYITQRGPAQHGETVNAVWLKPRVVQLLIRHDFDSRNGYWFGRERLISVLSPMRQVSDGLIAPGTLRKMLSTGAIRDLSVRIAEGPGFKPRSLTQWDEWAYQEVIRFIAHDPVYTDPMQNHYLFDKQGGQLIFPITFPIQFSTIDQRTTIYYGGTWRAYPQFVLTGPMTMAHIHNFTTDEQLLIEYPLMLGETITISLDYGNKSVTKDDGTNLLGYVSADSDIGTFHLTENNSGANDIRVFAHGVMPPSQIEMFWNLRYMGV